jgi:hypothetical protein
MKVLLTAFSLAVLPVAALAQQPPTQTLLQENVVKEIGSFWSPTQFRVVAKQFDQNPLKPSFMVRFQMDATNPAALYVLNGKKVGTEEVLVVTVPAKSTRTFYGTEDLTYSAGAWSGPTTIENPADKLGKPIDFYTVPTLVLGSDQYKAAVARQVTFSLDQLKAQFQKRLDALEKADAAKVADIQESFATGLQNLHTAFGDKLKQQQTEIAAELAALLTKSRQALADQQKEVEKAWADLITQQRDALAKLRLGLQTTQQAVAAKIKLAQAAIDTQKQLIALQQQALANNATIASLKTKLAEKEKAQLASFEGTWGGTLRCDKKNNPWQIYATEMELTLSKQVGGMLSGQMTVTGGDVSGGGYAQIRTNQPIPASLQIMNVNGNGPLQLNILTDGKNNTEKYFLNFEVQLDPSGVLKGNVVHKPEDCSVIFSR